MRTTVALDHDLVRFAQQYPGVAEKTALIREALKALIERESSGRFGTPGRHNAGIEEPSTPEDEAELILADTSTWIDHAAGQSAHAHTRLV